MLEHKQSTLSNRDRPEASIPGAQPEGSCVGSSFLYVNARYWDSSELVLDSQVLHLQMRSFVVKQYFLIRSFSGS